MEEYKRTDFKRNEVIRTDHMRPEDLREEQNRIDVSKTISAKEIVEKHLRERAAQLSRRKWGGRSLIIFGSIMLVGSCPFYALSLIGPHTIIAALALIAGGSALLAWQPKLKDTNEALLIAAKHGNCLTIPRLALEMDISFEKADRIIQELVKSGIAEIDLDVNDPDQPIVYKIKGL